MCLMDKISNFMPPAPTGGKITWSIAFSYIFDYAIIAILAVIYAALDKILTPFSQHFSLTNISLQYPIADPERVPIWLAMVYSAGAPIIIISIYTLVLDGLFSHSKKSSSRFQRYTLGQRLWELNCGILGLFLAQGAAFVITGSLKNLIGKPRPDFIMRCLPQPGSVDPSPFGLSNKTICTQTDQAIMQDGFRSFPSGHSSSSFAGLFYLSLYLAAKLHVLDQRGEVWRTVIVLVPTLAAALIAGSRIIDARHHPFDVMFGSALGILCGWMAYRQYFPPVSHTWEKGRAYPMRMWGVRLRQPDGMLSADGQIYNYSTQKVDRTANAVYDDEEDRQALVGMESMRGHAPGYSTSSNPPSFQAFQQRAASPTTSHDDTDYEHVRTKSGRIAKSMPSERLYGSRGRSSTGSSNEFREQIGRNQDARNELDEQDLAYPRAMR